jgi:hypothetical protein
MPTIGEILQTGTSFCVGSALTPLLGKRMKDKHSNSLVKLEGQGSMITKTQGVHMVRVIDTLVNLSCNKRTRDEHGRTCVQHGLTSW